MKSKDAGWRAAIGAQYGAESAGGRVRPQVLDGTGRPARLVFDAADGRPHAARLTRWIAIIRPDQGPGHAARIVWLLDARTVRWSRGTPPGELYQGVTGLNAEQAPILWFRSGHDDGGGRTFTASGVFGASGIVDAARVYVAARRWRRQVRLHLAVDAQMWGLAAGADTFPVAGSWLTITAAGAPRPLELTVIRDWMSLIEA